MHQLLNSCSIIWHYSRRFSFWLFDWTLGYHWDGIVVLCFSNSLSPLFILPPSMAGGISASSRFTHTKTDSTTTVISGAWNNFGTVLVTTNFWPPRSFISVRVCTLRWLSRTQWWKNHNYCIGILTKRILSVAVQISWNYYLLISSGNWGTWFKSNFAHHMNR